MISGWRTKIWWIAASLFLAIWFPFFSTTLRPHNDSFSDALVTNALLNSSGKGSVPASYLGTSMPFTMGPTEVLLQNTPKETYKSAFGLQGYLAVWAWNATGKQDLQTTVYGLRILYSGLLAALLLALCASIRKMYGNTAFAVSVLMVAASPFVAFFGRSLHWQGWLIFAPFVFSWVAYPRFARLGKTRNFWILAGALIFVRSLVGYEFLSNLCLAMCIRPLLYHLEDGTLESSWKAICLRSVLAVFFGFSAAATVHIAALSPEVGGPIEAIRHIKSRASDRMGSHLSIEDQIRFKGKPRSSAETIKSYGKEYGPIMLPNGLALLAAAALFVSALVRRLKDEAIMLGFGLAGSLSWAVLMWNHMIIGVVHNPIIFFLPLYFMLAIVVSKRLKALDS